jgi:hypothetical protein
VSLQTRGSCSAFISITEEAHKASKAGLKRQFALFGAEFRGHAAAIVEEMDAYMRVLLQYDRCMRTDIVLFRDKVEIDIENMQDAECISAEAFANAAREWNAQRVSIQSKEGAN